MSLFLTFDFNAAQPKILRAYETKKIFTQFSSDDRRQYTYPPQSNLFTDNIIPIAIVTGFLAGELLKLSLYYHCFTPDNYNFNRICLYKMGAYSYKDRDNIAAIAFPLLGIILSAALFSAWESESVRMEEMKQKKIGYIHRCRERAMRAFSEYSNNDIHSPLKNEHLIIVLRALAKGKWRSLLEKMSPQQLEHIMLNGSMRMKKYAARVSKFRMIQS